MARLADITVGDRIIVKNVSFDNTDEPMTGDTGTVVKMSEYDILVEFDRVIPDGHDGGGIGRDRHCWWIMPKDIEILQENDVRLDNLDTKDLFDLIGIAL